MAQSSFLFLWLNLSVYSDAQPADRTIIEQASLSAAAATMVFHRSRSPGSSYPGQAPLSCLGSLLRSKLLLLTLVEMCCRTMPILRCHQLPILPPPQCSHRNAQYSHKECGLHREDLIKGYLYGQNYILTATVHYAGM